MTGWKWSSGSGHSDQLLVLRKPFEPIEVLQCAAMLLTNKWFNERIIRAQVASLQQDVSVRSQGLEAANRQLRHLATHDALTGLPNRVFARRSHRAGPHSPLIVSNILLR